MNQRRILLIGTTGASADLARLIGGRGDARITAVADGGDADVPGFIGRFARGAEHVELLGRWLDETRTADLALVADHGLTPSALFELLSRAGLPALVMSAGAMRDDRSDLRRHARSWSPRVDVGLALPRRTTPVAEDGDVAHVSVRVDVPARDGDALGSGAIEGIAGGLAMLGTDASSALEITATPPATRIPRGRRRRRAEAAMPLMRGADITVRTESGREVRVTSRLRRRPDPGWIVDRERTSGAAAPVTLAPIAVARTAVIEGTFAALAGRRGFGGYGELVRLAEIANAVLGSAASGEPFEIPARDVF